MIIQIEPTSKIVELNGVPARVWEGRTEKGIPCHLYITRIAVAKTENDEEFQRDLQETTPPTPEIDALPARMIL